MKIFAQVSEPVKPKTSNIKPIAMFYAAILVVFAVAQLFSFEDFLRMFDGYEIFANEANTRLLSAIIVVAEIFALPFLLNMRVSKLMRVVSMVMGWLVASIWVGISGWLVLSTGTYDNVGFLGTVINLTPGWWALFIAINIGVLSAWVSWGMWPFAGQRKRKRLPVKK